MYKIRIKFEQEGVLPVELKEVKAGQTLLEICLKNNIALHHRCGGVCACSSCHLYVHEGKHHLEALTPREKDFIHHTLDPRPDSRLGCQCLLIDKAGEIEVRLPDQTQFSGE